MAAGKAIRERFPNLNCGLCGFPTCDEFADHVESDPSLLERCVNVLPEPPATPSERGAEPVANPCEGCALTVPTESGDGWVDSLGREFDFVLQIFPQDPGPRETIVPHNPALTRELGLKPGDVLVGRPLGMSCGCPLTHCGVVQEADPRTGVIVWCVTGPLRPRQEGFTDIGFYSAQAYEGLVSESRSPLQIGRRYWFLPRRCMLQWRHSGLINYLARSGGIHRVRIEGLMIG
jgi:uncharacterized protein